MILAGASARAQVVFNEIMADNASTVVLDGTNNATYFPDYVEFYNTTGAAIDMGDGTWGLTDEPGVTNAAKYVFPPGTIIGANNYLLVFCDDKTNRAGLHTGFGLSGKGEQLLLWHGGVQPIAQLSFGPQVKGYSIGRVPDIIGDFVLTLPTPVGGSLPSRTNEPAFVDTSLATLTNSLRINEWLAFNLSGSGKTNDDWFEVYNGSTNVVLLSGLVFSDSNTSKRFSSHRAVPPLCFIGPLGFVQIFANDKDNSADEVKFSLSSTSGDDVYIWHYADPGNRLANETLVDRVTFGPLATANVSRGRVPDGSSNIVVLPNLSPGSRNFGRITEIIINEVLPHTDLPLEDAIELYNPTTTNVNIGDWWLTNDPEVPKKFRIPANTIVPPGGYVVFYEGRGASVGFNKKGTGNTPEFTLNSANGDDVYLWKGNPDGTLTGDRIGIDFGESQNGVSFGRYVTSTGDADYVGMSARTFGRDTPGTVKDFRKGAGLTNSYPKVGPVIISEIHYHPPEIVVMVDNDLDEFIEIRNISGSRVLLYDLLFPTNQWRIKDAVNFTFPPNQSLATDEYALIVNFNPVTNEVQLAAFHATFPNIPVGTKIYGPYTSGNLNNNNATLELAWPDRPQAVDRVDAGFVPYVVMDRLKYNDKSPWPTNADGGGLSLQRRHDADYGNDVINWMEGTPTPGQFNTALGVEAPRIAVQPQSHSVQALRNTSFSVVSRGGPRTYQWTFNSTNLPDATNATLELFGVTADNAGPYQVLLSNIADVVISDVAMLTVTPSPPDTRAPTVAITTPSANARVTNASVALRGTAGDIVALRRVEYQMGSGSFLTATGMTAWGAQLTLEPGTNVITAQSVDTSGRVSAPDVHRVFYVVTSPLSLSINGMGGVTGATRGQRLEIGRRYTLTAAPNSGHVFSNWTGGVIGNQPKLSFLMSSNLEIVANFVPNPFLNVKGAYNGLIYVPDCATNAGAGFFNFNLTDRGTYTASVLLGGKKYPASGALDLEGFATNKLSLTKTSFVQVVWSVELHGSNTLSGSVSNGVWTAILLGDRAPTYVAPINSPLLGKYTWVLPGKGGSTNIPAGDSFGTLSIDRNNVATLAGTLAEGTKIAKKVPVSRDGKLPFYASLYSGKGSILGWLGTTNAPTEDISGDVCWIRPALTSLKIYTNGFNYMTNFIGSRYVATNPILNVTTGQVVLSDGRLDPSYVTSATLGANSKMTNTGPGKLVFTFTLSSGLFKGSYQPTNTVKAVPFNGAVLQKAGRASGFFINSNQSGRVSFEAVP